MMVTHMTQDQKSRLNKIQRSYGMSTEERVLLAVKNAGFDDWRGMCRVCKTERTGTLKDILNGNCPNCGAPSGKPS